MWALGYPDQARQWSDEALARAEALAHPFTIAFALTCAARLHLFLREPHRVHERADTAVALAGEQDFAQFLVQASIHRGSALAEQGQALDGLIRIRHRLSRLADHQSPRPYYLAFLAGTHVQAGQPEEGFCALTEALEAVQTFGERFMEAELYRLKGELWLARSAETQAEAEGCFQQALAIARQQQAKSWELRTTTSMARRWQHQDKRAEAYAGCWPPVYGWFTEGFDTRGSARGQGIAECAGVTRRRQTGPFSPTIWARVHNHLSSKYFHGVSAGNVPESSLKSRIGEVRTYLLAGGISYTHCMPL